MSETTYHTEIRSLTDAAAQTLALELLAAGQVIAAPTDTVYGVFCRPDDPAAIERLYWVKARPPVKAIPILISDVDQVTQVAQGPLSPLAAALMARFWPGALTVILPALPHLPDNLTAGQRTIGVRMPDHVGLRDFLRRAGPLAATSANLSGGAETHTVDEVAAQLADRLPLILAQDVPPDQRGPASTVVDVTGATPTILREGPLGAAVAACLAEFAEEDDLGAAG